jgi:predicted peptidase
MKRLLLPFLFSLLLSPLVSAQQPSKPEILTIPAELMEKTDGLNPDFLLCTPELKDSKEKLPLVIVLHGGGGLGNDVKMIAGQPRGIVHAIEKFGYAPTLVVAPQCTKETKSGERGGWFTPDLNLLLEHIKATLPVDEDRIYLTGISMGGYGSWMWAGNHPEHFAAIAPIVGGIGPNGPKDVAKDLDHWISNLMSVPVWAFVGAKDQVVPPENSKRIIDALVEKGHQDAHFTSYPDLGHDAGQRTVQDPEFFKWLFAKTRSQAQ